jgi:hypothetical protein
MMLLIGLGVIVLAFIVMFTKPGVMLKGAYNLLFKNMAETAEGAEMVFEKAIEESESKYARASDALRQVSGSLATQKERKLSLERDKSNYEKQCEKLVVQGLRDKAMVLAQAIETLTADIENCNRNIDKLTSSVNEATSLVSMCEAELIQLKMEKKTVVENLKLDSELLNTYNSIDELRKDTSVQKMLGYARDGSKEKKDQAVGAKIVHENKASTQLQEATKTAQGASALDYINKLEKKIKENAHSVNNAGEKVNTK